jgi:hypothetical protein
MATRQTKISEDSRWVPKNGEVYFLILGDGTIQSFQWHGTDFDQNAWSFGNCFRSRREATQARDVIKEVLSNFHKHG